MPDTGVPSGITGGQLHLQIFKTVCTKMMSQHCLYMLNFVQGNVSKCTLVKQCASGYGPTPLLGFCPWTPMGDFSLQAPTLTPLL